MTSSSNLQAPGDATTGAPAGVQVGRSSIRPQATSPRGPRLVYIKPTMSEDLHEARTSWSTRGTIRLSPRRRPADQFFDEGQFESYRELATS